MQQSLLKSFLLEKSTTQVVRRVRGAGPLFLPVEGGKETACPFDIQVILWQNYRKILNLLISVTVMNLRESTNYYNYVTQPSLYRPTYESWVVENCQRYVPTVYSVCFIVSASCKISWLIYLYKNVWIQMSVDDTIEIHHNECRSEICMATILIIIMLTKNRVHTNLDKPCMDRKQATSFTMSEFWVC